MLHLATNSANILHFNIINTHFTVETPERPQIIRFSLKKYFSMLLLDLNTLLIINN